MMRMFTGLSALLLGAALAPSAHAYTPESGIWWNPNESGSGVTIEVQDNLMVVAAYVGDAQGRATWYTATQFLTGNALLENVSLDLTQGSQCVGCSYFGRPTILPGVGGALRIVFNPNDETKATLTWGNGRTIPIERYEFYTKRGEDAANVPSDVTKMLGEWQWVTDFSESSTAPFPFYGDVLVFDQYELNTSNNRWFYEGCRADDSLVAGCSQNALSFHSASGYYDVANNLQVIVVDDSTTSYALYVSRIGTNDGEGEITVYPKGQNPGNLTYPARGWRTASRTYVEEEVGPNKAATGAAVRAGMGDMLGVDGVTKSIGAVPSKFDRAALAPIIAELEVRLEARKQR